MKYEDIVDNFLFGDGKDLEKDTSFLEIGILDSTGVIETEIKVEDTKNCCKILTRSRPLQNLLSNKKWKREFHRRQLEAQRDI